MWHSRRKREYEKLVVETDEEFDFEASLPSTTDDQYIHEKNYVFCDEKNKCFVLKLQEKTINLFDSFDCKKIISRGFTYASISGTLFGITSALSKYLGSEFGIDPIELAFIRFLACMIFAIPHATYSKHHIIYFKIRNSSLYAAERKGVNKRISLSAEGKARLLLLSRGIIVAPAISLTFDSLRYLPLSEATVLLFTSTVFTAFLASLLLKESFPVRRWAALALTFVGVILFAKLPEELVKVVENKNPPNYNQLRGCGEALGGALLMSFVYILARKTKDVHESVQVFHYASVASVSLLGYFFISGMTWKMPLCGWNSVPLFAMTVSSFYGQYCVSRALRSTAAGPVALIRAAFDLIVAYVVQMAIFYEIPDIYGIAGTVCVFSALLLMTK